MTYVPLQGLAPQNETMRTTKMGARRANSKRAVSPIIATILLVAITVVLAAVLYILISGYTSGGQSSPLGSALSLGTAVVGSGPAPTVWYENLSVQSASTSLTINSLTFSVQTTSGGVMAAPAGSIVQMISSTSGSVVATYTFSTAAWTGASLSTHVTSTDIFSVQWKQTVAADPLTGDKLVTSGSNGFQGTVSNVLA